MNNIELNCNFKVALKKNIYKLFKISQLRIMKSTILLNCLHKSELKY